MAPSLSAWLVKVTQPSPPHAEPPHRALSPHLHTSPLQPLAAPPHLSPPFSQEQLDGWGDKSGCVMGKSENTHRNSSFFCSHMGGKRKHHQVPRQCHLSNCLLPDRGTSRAIPAGPGCHKIRKNCTTGDWSKPVVVWMLSAHLTADEWAWTEPRLRNENRTQGKHQYSIFTGNSERCSNFGKIPWKHSLPLHKQDVAFQTESIPWWCQHQISKMACQEWRFKLSKLIDNLTSIKAQISFQIVVLISINTKHL